MVNFAINTVKGLGNSCATRIGNKWIVRGDKSASPYEEGFCYKADLDVKQVLSLPEDTPIYASEGCFEVTDSGLLSISDEYTSVNDFKDLVKATIQKIVDYFGDLDEFEFKLKKNIKNSKAAFEEVAECIFEYVSWEYMETCADELLDDMEGSPDCYSTIFEER